MHKEARHSHGGSKESMSLFSAMLASQYGRCMEMRMRLPALWLSSKRSPPLCMTKGTPCGLSGTSAASSGRVFFTHFIAIQCGCCFCTYFGYSPTCQYLHPEILYCPEKPAVPACCAHHVLYRSHHLVERANIYALLLGTITTDVPLAHCTHEPFGPMDNSVLFETTVRS